MRRTLGIVAAVALCVALNASYAQKEEEDEHEVERSALPPNVERAVASVSAGATLRGLSSEVENGQTFYEAELLAGGRSKDVLIDSNGNIVEIEEEVEVTALPSAVRDALIARAGKARIDRVESITKSGSVVAYEAQLKKGRKRSEIQIDPRGKIIEASE